MRLTKECGSGVLVDDVIEYAIDLILYILIEVNREII
jgi:hypothetical protein